MADIFVGEADLYEEWKKTASRLYELVDEVYKIVRIPPDPQVDFHKPGSVLPAGAKILTFDQVFESREAMNLLMSWAVDEFFPEDE